MVLLLKQWKSRSSPGIEAGAHKPIHNVPTPFVHYTDAHGGAGWSSPVARQAHNLKVTGSNPVPATNQNARKSNGFAGLFASCVNQPAVHTRRLTCVRPASGTSTCLVHERENALARRCERQQLSPDRRDRSSRIGSMITTPSGRTPRSATLHRRRSPSGSNSNRQVRTRPLLHPRACATTTVGLWSPMDERPGSRQSRMRPMAFERSLWTHPAKYGKRRMLPERTPCDASTVHKRRLRYFLPVLTGAGAGGATRGDDRIGGASFRTGARTARRFGCGSLRCRHGTAGRFPRWGVVYGGT